MTYLTSRKSAADYHCGYVWLGLLYYLDYFNIFHTKRTPILKKIWNIDSQGVMSSHSIPNINYTATDRRVER